MAAVRDRLVHFAKSKPPVLKKLPFALEGVASAEFNSDATKLFVLLREFLERQAFKRGPVEIYGEMELLRLLDRFLDRALCFCDGAMSSTASCRIDRAVDALVARSWIGYRLCQSHII